MRVLLLSASRSLHPPFHRGGSGLLVAATARTAAFWRHSSHPQTMRGRNNAPQQRSIVDAFKGAAAAAALAAKPAAEPLSGEAAAAAAAAAPPASGRLKRKVAAAAPVVIDASSEDDEGAGLEDSGAAADDASTGGSNGDAASGSGSDDERPNARPTAATAPRPAAPRKPVGKRAAAATTTTAEPATTFSDDEVNAGRAALLAWYDAGHRILPWRRNPHSRLDASAAVEPSREPAPADLPPQAFAYRVWVSEVMLQQTQVATVEAYFKKWVARWPSVAALAAATQEEVNATWAGLGYYRRARYLLDGARFVMAAPPGGLGGAFPDTAAGLRSIPGVGPYTAAAVASIAFGDAAAAVDGNVIRVVSRLRALRGDPGRNARAIEALAARLLHPQRPGCHNQAMMELGATVCKPANPACGACPLRGCCSAYSLQEGAGGVDIEDAGGVRVTDFPEKVAKAAKREQHVAVTVLRVLLPPPVEGSAGGDAAAAAAAAKRRKAAAGIRAFTVPAPREGAGAGGDDDEAALLARGAVAHYLLVQRPDSGLLAGLWECPGVIVEDGAEAAASAKARQPLVDAYLAGELGVTLPRGADADSGASAAGAPRVLSRRACGSAVHVFSHIRQTMHVDALTLAAPRLDAVCACAAAVEHGQGAAPSPATKWVSEAELAELGLTTGVRKALALASGGGKAKGKGGKGAK